MRAEIKKYLPQREPFLFVDQIECLSEVLFVGSKFFPPDFLFAQKIGCDFQVPSMILLEALVQSGGAGINKLEKNAGTLFFLAGMGKVKIKNQVPLESDVDFKVTTLKSSAKRLVQEGIVSCQGKFILSASWYCLRARDSTV